MYHQNMGHPLQMQPQRGRGGGQPGIRRPPPMEPRQAAKASLHASHNTSEENSLPGMIEKKSAFIPFTNKSSL